MSHTISRKSTKRPPRPERSQGNSMEVDSSQEATGEAENLDVERDLTKDPGGSKHFELP